MRGPRGVIGLCLICMIVLSAVAAAGASAKGTTVFTCVRESSAVHRFADAHCKVPSVGGDTGMYELKKFNVPTQLSGSNGETCNETKEACPTVLTSVVAGAELRVTATGVSLSGETENVLEGEEMVARGTTTITHEGATVTVPSGKGCEIEGGKFSTNKLKLTTAGQPAEEKGMFIKFEPNVGSAIGSFTVKGCTGTAEKFNKKYELTGSVKGTPDGGTVNFTEAGTTGQGTLFLNGQKAGIDGSLTFKGRAEESTEAFTALAPETE